jgi:hypothetical protein
VTITRIDRDHPQATAGIATGSYWDIQATNSAGEVSVDYVGTMTVQIDRKRTFSEPNSPFPHL